MRSIGALSFGIVLVAMTGIALAGCGTAPQPTSVVCTDFRAGADLSGSTFGVSRDLQRSYGAFAQAAGDLSAVASDLLHSVGTSCKALAVELGADGADPRTLGKLEPDAVRAWCKIAAERITILRPQLMSAHFAVQVVTPQCTIDTASQTACELTCRTNATCTEASPEERCPVDAREGLCPGVCTGTCTGSEIAPAACAGQCNGVCFGTCGDGAGDPDWTSGNVCTKVCTGECTAGCALPQGAHCDSPCAGTCSEPMLAQTCTKALAAPTCAGDVDCQKSCGATGAVRAACPGGSLAVVVDDAALADQSITRIVAVLERNLPAIFLAARGRAKVLGNGASDLLDAAGHILSRSSGIGPMGAACGMLIGETSSEAKKSLNAALDGSTDVAHAVSGDASAAPASAPDPSFVGATSRTSIRR